MSLFRHNDRKCYDTHRYLESGWGMDTFVWASKDIGFKYLVKVVQIFFFIMHN